MMTKSTRGGVSGFKRKKEEEEEEDGMPSGTRLSQVRGSRMSQREGRDGRYNRIWAV